MALDLEAELHLPPSVWGYFEWFTGVIRLNMNLGEFETEILSPQPQRKPNEAWYHEFFHCCQISTSGFLYYHVAHFLQEITPVWSKITQDGVTRNLSMSKLLESVIEGRPAVSVKLIELMLEFDRPSPGRDLTPRDIAESQAYFVQKRMVGCANTHDAYLKECRFAPSLEYAAAYLMATKYLGEKAYLHFASICYISLCFLKPQDVFEKICFLFSNGQTTPQDVFDALKADYFLLGDVDDVTVNYIKNQEINPFYKSPVCLLKKTAAERGLNLHELMTNPLPWFEETVKKFDLPVILNKVEIHQQLQEEKWEVFGKGYNKLFHFLLGSVCLIILNRQQQLAPHCLHLRKMPP